MVNGVGSVAITVTATDLEIVPCNFCKFYKSENCPRPTGRANRPTPRDETVTANIHFAGTIGRVAHCPRERVINCDPASWRYCYGWHHLSRWSGRRRHGRALRHRIEVKDMAPIQSDVIAGSSIDWRSVVGGAIGAAALSLVLMGFGGALGLSMTSARGYGGFSGTTIGILSAIWLALVYVMTFAAGGYIAGRMRKPTSPGSKEREFRDGAHGFLVWALGTLVGAYMLASVATGTAQTAVSAASSVAQAAGQMAGAASSTNAASELLAYNVDRMLRPTGAPTTTSAPQINARDTTEIARIIGISVANGTLSTVDRDYLASIVTRYGVAAPEATKRVDEAYNTLAVKKLELEQKARAVAESARKAGILAAFLLAAVSLVGMVAAAWSAACGGRDRDENRELQIFGQSRLW